MVGTGTTEEATEGPWEDCSPPIEPIALDYDFQFSGFPELEGGQVLVDEIPDKGFFHFQSQCTVEAVNSTAHRQEIRLACDHSKSQNAEVILGLNRIDLTVLLALGEEVEFKLKFRLFDGGFFDALNSDSQGHRGISPAFKEYTIHKSDGLFFAAEHGMGFYGHRDFGDLQLAMVDDCPRKVPFYDPTKARFTLSTAETSIDLNVGQFGELSLGNRRWEARVTEASRWCCHGDLGSYRIVRTQ